MVQRDCDYFPEKAKIKALLWQHFSHLENIDQECISHLSLTYFMFGSLNTNIYDLNF